MKTPVNTYKHLAIIFSVTAVILLIPLIAMQFSNEVTWDIFDFIVAGFLLIGTGLTFEFISQKSISIVYKIAVGLAAGTTLFLIWANLAVGIIGSEDNPVNLMYFIIPLIGLAGAFVSRFKPKGMSLTLFAMAIIQILIPVIAIIIFKPDTNSSEAVSGIAAVLGINIFFAILFSTSAILFKRADYGDSK